MRIRRVDALTLVPRVLGQAGHIQRAQEMCPGRKGMILGLDVDARGLCVLRLGGMPLGAGCGYWGSVCPEAEGIPSGLDAGCPGTGLCVPLKAERRWLRSYLLWNLGWSWV